MAVAAHVSRVAKEYAPHGYSIMEDVTYAITNATAAGSQRLGYVEDAGIYVESAQLFITSGAADGSNTLGFELQYADNDGSYTSATDIVAVVQTSTLANNVANNLTIVGAVVPSDKILSAVWSAETGTAVPAGMFLKLRIRRKA